MSFTRAFSSSKAFNVGIIEIEDVIRCIRDVRRMLASSLLTSEYGITRKPNERSVEMAVDVPGVKPSDDSLTKEQRRVSLHEYVMQKVAKAVRHRAEVLKPASCHTLRQSCAPISRIIAAMEKISQSKM